MELESNGVLIITPKLHYSAEIDINISVNFKTRGELP